MSKNTYRPFRPGRPPRRWMEIAGCVAVAAGIMLVAAVCYLEIFAPEEAAAPEPTLSAEMEPLPPEQPPTSAPPEVECPVQQDFIKEGDTAGDLLKQWLTASETHALVTACEVVYPLARLRVGQSYSAFLEEDQLNRFEYEIDNDSRLIISREGDAWAAKTEPIEYDVRLVRVEGSIGSSLFLTMADIGENAALAVRLAEIFAWEINFIRDIQPGDSFRLLVEKRYRNGEFKGYGTMHMAEFVNRNSKFEAYLHLDSFGKPTYFTAAGDSLKRAFLKAPLSYTRISSRFNPKRMHPILKQVRAHPAVDYAAPTGTPVKAIGNGAVHFRGQSKGAGNYIVLRHTNGFESMYLHLNGFAKNLKQGNRVRQGEIIGYVGSTGYSTGPHLDFRMKKNGQFVNPEKILSPRDESVPKDKLETFKAERDRYRLFMDDDTALAAFNIREGNAPNE